MPRLRRTTQARQREANPDMELISQLDALQDAADTERDKRVGSGWFDDVRSFFNIDPGAQNAPTFRPRIIVPELQTLFLNECTDLSDALPRVFITNKQKREEAREEAYQQNWRESSYNNRLLECSLWALFGGTGFVQVGFDPYARFGRGEVYIESRDPDSVHPDPSTKDWKRWAYVQFEDRLYIDEVRSRWSQTGWKVVPRRGPAPGLTATAGASGATLIMPPGPMSVGPGLSQKLVSSDSIVTVRHSFIRDYTVEKLEPEERDRIADVVDAVMAIPKYKRKYPNGRWIVDCEGVILADGPNPFPLGLFPIVPYRALPSLGWFWGVPPMRYSRSLQFVAERMLTQTFENAVRLNNGIWFIDESTGLSADDFGGLPAEIQVINSNSRVPEVKWPSPMPAHMTQLPSMLFDIQRRIQGFTPARAGQTSPGNQSADLYDSTVFNSQFLTRLRSRLMAESTQAVAELVFYCMCRFLNDGAAFAGIKSGDVKWTSWDKVSDDTLNDYSIMLDPGSLRVVSMNALRTLYMELLSKNLIPLKYALEAMEIPQADEIAEAQQQQLELAALSRIKRPR